MLILEQIIVPRINIKMNLIELLNNFPISHSRYLKLTTVQHLSEVDFRE